MVIRAALQIQSGLPCTVAAMSKDDRDITVLNPMYLPHWIHVRSKRASERSSWYDQHTESLTRLALTRACSQCTLIPLCRSLGVHITRFRALNGLIYLEIIATRKVSTEFFKQMDKFYKFVVLNVSSFLPENTSSGLSVHGLNAVKLAFAEGYYDYPRKVRLSTLANQIGRSSSALCETLRRTERAMLQRLLESQDNFIIPRTSPSQPLVHSPVSKENELIEHIFKSDSRIRLCAILDQNARRIAGGMRRGVKSLEPASETGRLQRDEITTRRMDDAWDAYFGRTNLTIENRERILLINFYLPDSRIVVVTAEPDYPMRKVRELQELIAKFKIEIVS